MKPFWKSKTFWVAVISLFVVFAAEAFGIEISSQVQAMVMSLIMVIMRAITKEPISFSIRQ